MNENSISSNSNEAEGSKENQSVTFQVDVSDLLNDIDTLRARIEHLENVFAVENLDKQARTTGHFTISKIISAAESKFKTWIRNRRSKSPTPQ